MQNKTLEQLELELYQSQQKIEIYEKQIQQYENQIKTVIARMSNEKRKIRTHRLCERGAIAESLIPNAEKFTNEQIKELLSVALATSEARAFLQNVILLE